MIRSSRKCAPLAKRYCARPAVRSLRLSNLFGSERVSFVERIGVRACDDDARECRPVFSLARLVPSALRRHAQERVPILMIESARANMTWWRTLVVAKFVGHSLSQYRWTNECGIMLSKAILGSAKDSLAFEIASSNEHWSSAHCGTLAVKCRVDARALTLRLSRRHCSMLAPSAPGEVNLRADARHGCLNCVLRRRVSA